MRILKVVDEHSFEDIKHEIRSHKGYNDVIDWKIIQAVKQNPGLDAKTISKVFCLSVKKIYTVIEEYNKLGKDYKQNSQWGGRRNETSFMSLEEERAFLENLRQKAKKGLILTAKNIKADLEKLVKHTVSEDYIWEMFKRHNWKKKSPRPEHPKTDYAKQEDFKKNSQKIWQPPN